MYDGGLPDTPEALRLVSAGKEGRENPAVSVLHGQPIDKITEPADRQQCTQIGAPVDGLLGNAVSVRRPHLATATVALKQFKFEISAAMGAALDAMGRFPTVFFIGHGFLLWFPEITEWQAAPGDFDRAPSLPLPGRRCFRGPPSSADAASRRHSRPLSALRCASLATAECQTAQLTDCS